jgi:general secretion pathway protein D
VTTSLARRPRVLLLCVLTAACATDRTHRERAFERGAYEEAIASLEEAVRKDPGNLELRLELRARREAALQQLIAAGDSARAKGNGDAAATSYRRVLTIEPGNDRALRGLDGVQADRRHAERTAKAAQLLAANKLDAAELEAHAVLAEDPGFAAARSLLSRVDLARGPTSAVPRL